MAVVITLNESNASRRCVPMWCVQSNGTSAATNESGSTFFFSLGGVDYTSGGSLSVISANAGLYSANFSASKVSVQGQGFAYYSSQTALPTMTPFMVVPYDSMDSQRLGLFALPSSGQVSVFSSGDSVGLKAQTHSGATVGAGNFAPGVYSGVSFSIRDSGIAVTSFQLGNYSGVSVEVKSGGIQTTSVGAGNYSGVSVEIKTKGIDTNSINSATYSGVTFGVNNIAAGTFSGVTVGVNNIAPGTYSGVSIEVKTGGIQTASIGAGSYSGVSVEIKTGGIQTASIGKGSYSGVTVEISNIAAGAYSGVTIDGAKFLSTAGERSAASSLLSTSLGGTTPRLIQQSFELLRNKVTISGSTMTVFKSDDATSSWTATISTGTATVYGVTPGLA